MFVLSVSAQKVHIIDMNRDFVRQNNVEGFEYLHDEMNNDTYAWLANVLIEFDTIHPKTLKEFYLKLNERANKMGANAFRVKDADLSQTSESKFIELDFFFLNYEDRKENKYLFRDESIYIFGFLGHHKNMAGYKIEINQQKLIISEQSYLEIHPKIGDELQIKLGRGLKKDELNTIIEEGMFPRYYRFNVYRGPFSRSVIDEHEWSFGEFLIRILTKRQFTLS